ncbi:MAG: hypothetical protein RSG52_13460 [Terrisporobacter sp.]|uniref:hypothetical protein n=1 Tax=Terrisporobacter sp. TaxID=1965305 RepID=UPI002FC64083
MKKLKFLLLSMIFATIIFSNSSFATSYDFTSNHITVENDETLTKEFGYPVLRVKNNIDKDLDVTYSFYVNTTDSANYDNNFIVKAKEETLLKLPELHHLGSNNETRKIWFSWSEEGTMKPLQTEIETITFESTKVPELG